MEKEFSEEILRERISDLVIWKKIIFLLSICERMYPNFVMFYMDVSYNREDVLRIALDTVWELLQQGITKYDLTDLAIKCEEIGPETEDYSSIFVSSALDSAVATSLLTKMLSDNNLDSVIEGASLARDSVDMYAQELEDLDPNAFDIEEEIIKHPLMQKELKRQCQDIEFLANLDDDIQASLPELVKKWKNTKESCLGLTIE